MQTSSPLIIAGIAGVSAYLFFLWVSDLRAYSRGEDTKGRLPGAAPCGWRAIWVAVVGALVLVGAETGAEYWINRAAHQRDVTGMYLLLMISAAFTEELIFRGYIVVTGKGRAWLIGSILAASVVFALLHPYLWEWEQELLLRPTPAALVTTGAVLAKSLWFYTMRFFPLNSARSLLPCIAAHLAANVAVFVIKGLQGHVVGWV